MQAATDKKAGRGGTVGWRGASRAGRPSRAASQREESMKKIATILATLALSTGVVGATAASARWHHPKKHKVCRTSWHNHHRVTRCTWR